VINLKSALTQTELDEGLDGLNDVSQAQVRSRQYGHQVHCSQHN